MPWLYGDAIWNYEEIVMTKKMLILAVAIGLKGIEAMACSCAPVSVSDSYGKMAAIFEGTVTKVKRTTGSHYSPKIITLKVSRKWKGLDSEQEVALRTAGISASCGSQFDVGDTYL